MPNLEQAALQAIETLRNLHESCQSNGEIINVADEICSLRAALEDHSANEQTADKLVRGYVNAVVSDKRDDAAEFAMRMIDYVCQSNTSIAKGEPK